MGVREEGRCEDGRFWIKRDISEFRVSKVEAFHERRR